MPEKAPKEASFHCPGRALPAPLDPEKHASPASIIGLSRADTNEYISAWVVALAMGKSAKQSQFFLEANRS